MPVFSSLGITHDAEERRIARLRLNRPDRLNAIDANMPGDIRAAVFTSLGIAHDAERMKTR